MVASGDGDGVGADTEVGVAWRVGDGAKVPVGDGCGEGVQLNARENATNPNDIANNLLIADGACREGAEWTCLV